MSTGIFKDSILCCSISLHKCKIIGKQNKYRGEEDKKTNVI